ncbi:GNVR domain-containing protein [Spirosoma endbachense]|uniref:Lipopolysaccharide biosynthesis protein n=1 Tax=Spirosoma endbachense TaxID=2666025 RepID=A0A6P1W580_9BACT|nr:GNVR domain-containing protein [Spirosoma endbachense]QHW00504.1 lipopolysaccharide biosynthesis protein [Spirosoma endbachense]
MSVTETKRKEIIDDDEIEIRLSDIIGFLKNSRRRIIIGALIGFTVGALYAFSKSNIYTSQVTVMPEIQARSGGLGGLGSLAGLAGIDINSATGGGVDAIRPDVYPDVLQSVPFALYLLKQPVYSQKLQAKMSLAKFVNQINASGFIGIIAGMFSKKDEITKDERLDPGNFSQAIQVTKEQEELIKVIQKTVTALYDKKTGLLTLTSSVQDPVVAATVARLSLEYLTNYITTYRTEKARRQVTFLVQRVNEAKSRYQTAEYILSTYRDRNRNVFLNTAKIDEQRLQADFLLEQSVYNELSKQLEQAKIKVQDETPVFKILEPPTVPLRKSAPKRSLIILGFGIVGGIVSIIGAFIRRIQLNTKSL